MEFEYREIVRQWYEEIKPLFINYLHKNFPSLDYDEILYIYSDVWMAVYDNIRNGKIERGTKWRAYILKVGFNQASKIATQRSKHDSLDDETFNREAFEKEYTEAKAAEASIYNDPELNEVLAAELSYIPNPCNTVLRMYYFDNISISELAEEMNYHDANSAKTIKNRCLDRLRKRVFETVRKLGIVA